MEATMSRLPDPFTDTIAPGFVGARLTDNSPTIYDEMPNGRVLRVKSSAQFWSLELPYPELFYEEYAYLSSFLAEVQRTGGTIDVLLPHYENFRINGDTSLCSIPSGQKGSTLLINGISNLTGRPNIGDLFKLSEGTKVYKITGYVVDTLTDTATLSLYPDLAHTTTGSEKPVFNGVLLTMVLQDDNLPTEDPDVDGLYRGFQINLREQING